VYKLFDGVPDVVGSGEEGDGRRRRFECLESLKRILLDPNIVMVLGNS
jgi:hypothetical protein